MESQRVGISDEFKKVLRLENAIWAPAILMKVKSLVSFPSP